MSKDTTHCGLSMNAINIGLSRDIVSTTVSGYRDIIYSVKYNAVNISKTNIQKEKLTYTE